MGKGIEETKLEIMDFINDNTDANLLSKHDYATLMNDLSDDLKIMAEAAEQELEEEEEDEDE